MSSNTATGYVLQVGPTEQKSEKFRCRQLVLKTDANSQYPQEVAFQLSQDRCELADNLREGQLVTVHYNLRGRRWEKDGKVAYFNTLDVWRIEAAAEQPSTGHSGVMEPDTANTQQKEITGDLPF